MKKIILILLISAFSFAQNTERIFNKVGYENNNVAIHLNDGFYTFEFLNEAIVETTYVPKGEKYNPVSYARVLKTNGFTTNIEKNGNIILLSGSENGIKVKITESPFQIQYLDANNKLIIAENKGYYKEEHLPLDRVKDNIVADSLEVIDFSISKDEVLYGGGARVLGMNRRGNRLALYNRADYGYETRSELMNFTLPIFLSSNKYMLHFDNAPIGYLDLDSKNNNTIKYETISGRKVYQVITGETWEALIDNYTNLTGKQPLPPQWALGNFSSRFGYHSEVEAKATIAKFKKDNIPVDAIILDLYWFGKDIKGTMGNLEVFRDSFPNFEKMVSDFKSQGVKTITVTEPFILTNSKKWNETNTNNYLATNADGSSATWDFYFGNTGLVDVFKPEAKKWFWSIYKDLHSKGVAGIWGDLGEPEVFPSWANTVAGKADEVHNVYGHNWAKLISEGYKKDFPNERPFILMRAGAAGSQRYGMIPWSGDVNRTWGGLSGQVEIALQMGMQGLAYMHSDLGGFAGDLLDDELYTRWLQYGVFQPIYRPHAQDGVASEPVFRSEKAKELAKCAVELRYQMLPYNYNLAFTNNQKGTPLMRPLFFEETENESLYHKKDGYLWGNDFLIYPVLKSNVTSKEIYFPKSSNWVDFYTHKTYKAGSTETVNVVKNHIPTFVREGVILPFSAIVQNTTDYNPNQLELRLYFNKNQTEETEQTLYSDDGLTANAFEKGAFEILHFETDLEGRFLEIDIERELGKNATLEKKNFKMMVYNLDKKPKNIKYNGKKIPFTFNSENKSIAFEFQLLNLDSELRIKL